MGMGWARGIGNFFNEEAKNIHDHYDPMQKWLQGAWHSVHGQDIPDQPGLHSLAHGIEKQPANYAAAILGAIYGAGALAGSSAGGAVGEAGGATAGGTASGVPVEEAGFAAGSTPSGAGWTAGTGGTGFTSPLSTGQSGNLLSRLMQGGSSSGQTGGTSGAAKKSTVSAPSTQSDQLPKPEFSAMDSLVKKALLYTGETDMNYSHDDITALLAQIADEQQSKSTDTPTSAPSQV